jgi:hypothetical protein
METLMFSLKIDLLLPTLAALKEAVHRLNDRPSDPRPPTDGREAWRIRCELREARDKLRLDLARRRYHVF